MEVFNGSNAPTSTVTINSSLLNCFSCLCIASVRSPVPAASQQPSQSDQELVEVKGLLRTAEEQKGELAEQLKNANATVEQYRTVVLTLEDSLKKEKEV